MSKWADPLFELLPRVEKAARYTGGEVNMVRKDLGSVDLRAVLIYPDLYEIGMSNLGLRILYDILNRNPRVFAERAFHPWVDLEDEMRRGGVPLLSLETLTPVKEFDLIGFSLGTELVYTNVLNVLDLAGVPLRGDRRGEEDPLVIGGGVCAYNPEPLADFFDLFLIGDGEEAIGEIAERLMELRGERRDEKLRSLSAIPGVYIPAFYRPVYDDDGRFARLEAATAGAPERIERRVLPALGGDFQVENPLVPLLEITHDRLSIEIMRGCTRGCRFCLAGTVYRPVRELSVDEATRSAGRSLARTGWEEISLVSLSSSDYSNLLPLLDGLRSVVEPGRVALSLPSQRPDAFTGEMADALSAVKRTGLTFAVEAGSSRLRNVINKGISDDEILRIVSEVVARGWRSLKFYFMIGLPTETEEDIEGVERLVRSVFAIGRRAHRRFNLNVNVSPFVPKPHTPFQWVAQEGVDSLLEKGRRLKARLSSRGIKIKLSDPRSSFIEGILSRGDRRVARVVEEAWRSGARLDGWSRFFRSDLWQEAFERVGLDPDGYTASIPEGSPLPWGHISTGISDGFLRREWDRALSGKMTPDCRVGPCQVCGLYPFPLEDRERLVRPPECSTEEIEDAPRPKIWRGRQPRRAPRSAPVRPAFRFRLKYTKSSRTCFFGHLDTIRALTRALRMIGAPLAYTRGYSPHPKLAFGPPLPLGLESESEYFDVQFERSVGLDLVSDLNRILPEGLRVVKCRPTTDAHKSLVSKIGFAAFRIEWPDRETESPDGEKLEEMIGDFMSREEALYERVPRTGDGEAVTLNLRPMVRSAELVERRPPVVRFVLAASPDKTARPLEVLELILGEPVPPGRLRLIREELFRVSPDGERLTPMDPNF